MLFCSGATERAAENWFESNRCAAHVPFVTASAKLETEHFGIEFFFVQKEESSFGFFDFSVEYSATKDLEGLFRNSIDSASMAARGTGHFTHLVLPHVTWVE